MSRANKKSLVKISCALLVAAAAFPLVSQASYHYSGNKCSYYSDYHGPGVCGNRLIPEGRNRNARDFTLTCSSGQDPHIRSRLRVPDEIYTQWKELEEDSRSTSAQNRFADLQKMHELRLSEAPITWSGILSYETVENWTWTSCEIHENGAICGYHSDPSTCTRQVADGRDKDGNTRYRTETYACTVQNPNSCKYDEDEHEAVACSNEVMDYKLTYAKPGADWHPPRNAGELNAEQKIPAHQRYYPIIPNKYDLLPGEVENVVTLSNSSNSSTISPTVQVGDAWNHYSTDIRFKNGGSSAACVYGRRYSIDVTMNTIGRDNTRQTPNAFRYPTDDQGKPKEPFLFQSTGDSSNHLVDARPSEIRLVDASNGTLEMMSKQMRTDELTLEEAKKKAGLGKTGNSSVSDEQAKEMFKDTKVRIALLEKNYVYGVDALGRDRWPVVNLYGGGENLLTLDGKFYDLHLDEEGFRLYEGRGNGPFKAWAKNINFNLKPNSEYQYMVSMYQENIPFYAQKGQKNVKWRELFHGEDSYYSKPLVIPFKSPKNIDQRGWLNRILDY